MPELIWLVIGPERDTCTVSTNIIKLYENWTFKGTEKTDIIIFDNSRHIGIGIYIGILFLIMLRYFQ